ncbi:MAG TPA: glycosyl hydrolase family 79 C-terminal domain-containing protein [Pseudonocardiaceae bacterium]
MRKSMVATALALITIGALGGSSAFAAAPKASTPVTVSVNSASAGTINSGFAGFSYEKDRIGAGMFDPNDTNMVNLFKLLGPSVLRVGGNLVDIVKWNPSGAGGSATAIAPSDVTKFAAFVKATGWKVLYGINLKTNTAANAASEAQVAAQALGTNLEAFEIGNEPNFYTSDSAYQSSYKSYVTAIKAKVPSAVFDGPGEGDKVDWDSSFASAEKSNSLTILANHLYIGSNTSGSISGMLASTASGRLPSTFATNQKAQKANGIPQWRMTETNSYYHGGTAGVSDVEAASLWSLNYLHDVAVAGGAGANFHGGTSTQFPLNYTPIVYSGLTPTGVQGVYYGELLWELGGTGAFHTASVSGGSNVTAWGIGNNVFVNNESTSAISATISLAGTASSANVYVLTAPSLTSKSVTIAGSAVSVSGGFNPAPTAASVSGGKVVVTIPADSAALVATS